jgi:hypothetical protein
LSPGSSNSFFNLLQNVQARPGTRPVSYSVGIWRSFTPGRIKRLGREAKHSVVSCAELKNGWSCTSDPQYVFVACMGSTLRFTLWKRNCSYGAGSNRVA